MTDIEKEGELFEQWWEDEGQYHRAGGDDYCKTFAWEAWIFIKAKAIPDGFVLVPKEPTDEMLIAADNCEIDWKVTAHNIYKAMIEAQEPTND